MMSAGRTSPSQQQAAGLQSAHLSGNNLSSNNPFRNRAASPSNLQVDSKGSSPSPFDDPPPRRPISRNPFLDQPTSLATTSKKPLSAEDIFNSLSLEDKKKMPTDRKLSTGQKERPLVDIDQGDGRATSRERPRRPKHRPTRSQEEALRALKPPSGNKEGTSLSPQRKPQRRRRRNSDSSILELDPKPLTEEQRKAQDARRRERERQRRDGRDGRDGKERSKSGRPSRRMDIIDQLDATSIYGTGLFHHDGPFDALNPHRNRNTSRRAPMHAFPKDSLNNSIGGSGPLNAQADHSTFMGNATEEAFRDYAAGARAKNGVVHPADAKKEPLIFDPIARGSPIHGNESYGLGTSTFLEGTPAARTAIARRQAEQAQEFTDGGLQRKKSLAQRIRSINRGPRDLSAPGRVTSPGGLSASSPDATVPAGSSAPTEQSPFFAEFSKGEDQLTIVNRNRALSPASPPNAARRGSGASLERRATTDATSGNDVPAKPSGLLGRMKSLKGGRRPKNIEPANSATSPGTAL